MEIIKLDQAIYAGREFTVRYTTNGSYDLSRTTTGFEIRYKRFERPRNKEFKDQLFREWLENPVAYGAFEEGVLLCLVEGSLEEWNNRYRINNLCVFDSERRHQGIGTALMQTILQEAEASGARMAVLETQTCNEGAIAFYQKLDFEIIGFDLYAYTNEDPKRQEIRLEMGRKIRSLR